MEQSTTVRIVKWVVIVALFIIPFVALIVANNFFFPFITGKNFAFRIIVEIALAGWVILALADKKYRPRWSWTLIIYTAFVVWMAIADAFAENPAKAFWSNFERMDGWVTMIHVFAFFLVTASVLSAEKLWKKWWGAFLIASAIMCGYCLLQVVHVFPIDQGGVRIDGLFGNAEYLAAYLLFTIAVSAWLAFEEKRAWLRYLLIALTVLELVVMYFTATRGAIIGLIGAAVLGAILWMIEAGKRGRRAAAGVIIALLVIIGGFYLIRDTSFIQKDPTLNRIASISLSAGDTRFAIWDMALKGFAARPVTGWGQEGFNYVFNEYYNPSLYTQEAWFDRAHDVFLDWLVAGGAPALILFLALLAATVVALYRSNVSRTERIMFISALAAYAFQGLFVFDNLFTYIPLAAIIAMAHMSSSKPITKLDTAGALADAQLGAIALPVGIVVLIVVIWFVNVPSMRAAVDLITALEAPTVSGNIAGFKQAYADGSFANQEISEQLMSFAESAVSDSSLSTSDKVSIFSYALPQMAAEVAKIPHDARLRLEFALGLRAAGDYTDALTQVHIAEQLSPEKQGIYVEEGIEDWGAGNPTAAQTAFNKAYTFDTSFTDLAAYAAAGDIANNQVAIGKAVLQQAFGTTTVDQDAVLLAYYQIKDWPDNIAIWQVRVKDQGYSAEAEFGLAAAYADAGDYADAKSEIQTAIAAHPDAASQGASMLQQLQQVESGGAPQ